MAWETVPASGSLPAPMSLRPGQLQRVKDNAASSARSCLPERPASARGHNAHANGQCGAALTAQRLLPGAAGTAPILTLQRHLCQTFEPRIIRRWTGPRRSGSQAFLLQRPVAQLPPRCGSGLSAAGLGLLRRARPAQPTRTALRHGPSGWQAGHALGCDTASRCFFRLIHIRCSWRTPIQVITGPSSLKAPLGRTCPDHRIRVPAPAGSNVSV